MKALSLTQPWASLVVLGEKRNETRSWATSYRGQIAIHASKGFPRWAKECVNSEEFEPSLRKHGYRGPSALPLGMILGTVYIIDCVKTEDYLRSQPREFLFSNEFQFGDYSEGRFVWTLALPIRLPDWIACNGSLGLWELSPEIECQLAKEKSNG